MSLFCRIFAVLLAASCFTPPAIAAPTSCTHPSASTEKPVRMVFGGDIVLGNNFLVDDLPSSWDESYFAGVRDIIRDADMTFGNLEGVLSERGETTKNPKAANQFAFRFPPRYAELLKREGFDIVNIANNHAYDFGESGFGDTLKNLQAADIAHVGPRDHAATFSAGGLNITMLGFSYSSRFASVFELGEDAERVRQAKAQGGFVIVTFHAGAEGPAAIWHSNKNEVFFGENRGNVVAFARAMIDAGADLVVGHGPHVLRAVECYKDKPIAYSLGNFVGVGGLSTRKMAAVSALLQVDVNSDGSVQALNLIPLRFNEQKLPEPDPLEFGTQLVNHLGRKAKYKANFVEFPVIKDKDPAFERWFKNASR